MSTLRTNEPRVQEITKTSGMLFGAIDRLRTPPQIPQSTVDLRGPAAQAAQEARRRALLASGRSSTMLGGTTSQARSFVRMLTGA